MAMCTLSACQNNVESETVGVQTQMQTTVETQLAIESETLLESESSLYQTSQKTVAEMVQAPEKVVYEFDNSGLSDEYTVETGIDAKIVIPEADSMDVVPLKSKIITEDDVKVLCEQFFSADAVYNPEEWIESYMEYVEGVILTEKELYESQKEYADPAVFDELDRLSAAGNWAWETILYLLDNAKGKSPDYKFCVLKNANGEDATFNLVCAIDGDYIKFLSVVNNAVEYYSYKLDESDTMEMFSIFLKNHIAEYSKYNFIWTAAYQSSDSTNNDPLFDMTRQEHAALFEELLLKCGFEDYTVEQTKRSGMEEPSWITDPEELEFYLSLRYSDSASRKYYNGVSIFGGNYSSRTFSGCASGRYVKDGWSIVSIEPTWMYEEPLVENVELLPYDRIEAIIKEVVDNDLNNDDSNTAMTKVKVTDIRLEYGILHDEELDADVLIPVWNCYTGNQNGESGPEFEEGEYYYTHYINLLTINAIDGSIIHLDNGSWLPY